VYPGTLRQQQIVIQSAYNPGMSVMNAINNIEAGDRRVAQKPMSRTAQSQIATNVNPKIKSAVIIRIEVR
jgi:hypothetical protein